jgi:hypothetical protein
MITETQATVQTIALIESLTNPIDQLAILDREVKELTEKMKALKDQVINQYGEGKHRGEQFGVNISLYESTTTDWKALVADQHIPAEIVAKFGKKNAVVRCSVTA